MSKPRIIDVETKEEKRDRLKEEKAKGKAIIKANIEEEAIPVDVGIYTNVEDDAEALLSKFKKATTPKAIKIVVEELDNRTSIDRAFDRYVTYHKGKGSSKATINAYEIAIKRVILFLTETLGTYGGRAPLMILEQPEFEENYRIWLEENEYKPLTINASMRCHKAFYRYCADNGWVEEKKLRMKFAAPEIKPVFTDEQLDKLLVKPKMKDNFIEYRNWVVVVFILNTGCRCGSVCGIKMKDAAALESGYITINTSKTNTPSRIAVPSRCVKILKEFIRTYRYDAVSEDYLFCTRYGEKLEPHSMTETIKDYMKARLGDDMPAGAGCHRLRHHFSYVYLRSGGNVLDLQKQLGHADAKMSIYYGNHWGEARHSEIEEHAPINSIKIKAGRKRIK